MPLEWLDFSLLIMAHALSLCAAGHALLTKRDPRSALGWIAVLVFLPVFGLIIYLTFGISRAHSRAERMFRKETRLAAIMGISKSAPRRLLMTSREAMLLAAAGDRITSIPLFGGNSVTPLHNGDEAYPAMLEAINAAKNEVFLTTYIFNYGKAASAFIEALKNADSRGVTTRVIVDGVGALYSWRKPWKILRGHGVKTARFRPPGLWPPRFDINLRCHRKLLVADHIGFTGGMNIADADMLHLPGKNHIQDMQFRCEGPIVEQLRQAFILNWAFCAGENLPLRTKPAPSAGASICRVVCDGPGNDLDMLADLYCGAINMSRHSVRIMTPYFLPPPDLMGALRSAAQRGVDVGIILPAKNNLAYMSWAMRRVLPDVLSAGARVFLQPPPFAHTKLLTVDGFYCQFGSANLDDRSLRLNFELNMEAYDTRLHDQLFDFMNATIAKSAELTLESLKNLSLPQKLLNSASWIFSPYF